MNKYLLVNISYSYTYYTRFSKVEVSILGCKDIIRIFIVIGEVFIKMILLEHDLNSSESPF